MLTTKRFAHVRQLVSLRNQIALYPTNCDDLMRDAIFDALPPQYADVCRFVKSHNGSVPSSMVATAFRLAQNHASSLLNELWQFGLLTREGDGNRFLYS